MTLLKAIENLSQEDFEEIEQRIHRLELELSRLRKIRDLAMAWIESQPPAPRKRRGRPKKRRTVDLPQRDFFKDIPDEPANGRQMADEVRNEEIDSGRVQRLTELRREVHNLIVANGPRTLKQLTTGTGETREMVESALAHAWFTKINATEWSLQPSSQLAGHGQSRSPGRKDR